MPAHVKRTYKTEYDDDDDDDDNSQNRPFYLLFLKVLTIKPLKFSESQRWEQSKKLGEGERGKWPNNQISLTSLMPTGIMLSPYPHANFVLFYERD